MPVSTLDYKSIALRKRQHRNAQFKKEWLVPEFELPTPETKDVSGWIENSDVLSEHELKITSASAEEIVSKIREGLWSAVDVTKAFCHRASVAHQLTNCLSEVFFDDAIEQAEKLDKFQQKNGKTLGPLHGLPIAMKDNFNIKGQATSVGIVSWSVSPEKAESDSVLVRILREMGAVFYVKTNVPVAMMMPETNNHIYGNTANPFNRLLSAGGSSGGGASLASLTNAIAVSTDIGGSIRIPASFAKVYSLRPTFGRFPTYGARSGLPGLESVNSVNGPICQDIDTLEFYSRIVVEGKPWLHDPKTVEIPWRPITLEGTMTFAVLSDDLIVRPTPPVLRAVDKVKAALINAGHEVIDWEPTDHLRLSEIITKFFVSDGGVHLKKEIDKTGEPFFPYMERYGTTPEMKVGELWDLHYERTSLAKKYLDRWNDTSSQTQTGKPIDAIIMPASPFAGNPHGKFHDHVGYTSPFNLLDYTAGTFPVTRVDQFVDIKENRSTFYCETDRKIWEDYSPEESHGGYVGLQIIGRKFEEEKVISMMKLVTNVCAPSL
ncbi:amidase [Metschnikowia bicuspidata var. bicuspidata NRRL YB-4993]|uniref:Amidase n=1 Tax=Metschnikowia bicuspidata var. bicuspidata NRRL YB-4993 TaxID=869754 RepID=A0A1A0H6P6_9ASCO|nr:amidase [Metschnikowia bicuspidata var. bicuspidata NRRL YB-4993]OBA19582.1 amidase [Metschnikowia bicuspidata var. bicuspidata NRRL YB-4993]